MRFTPVVLTAAAAILAKKPEIGVESELRCGPVDLILLGQVVVDGAGTPAWQAEAGVAIPAAGYDLHLRCDDPCSGLAGAPKVVLDVTCFGAAVTTAEAVIGVPAWVQDQSETYAAGWAKDFVPSGVGNADKTVIAIAGLDSHENLPANTTWSVWGSAVAANWNKIGYVRNKEGAYTAPTTVAIADGYNPQAATKAGVAEVSELTLEMVHVTAAGGLCRYNGQRIAPWVKVLKDKRVHTENIVYTGYIPAAKVTRGAGNDEVMERSTAAFERHLIFMAE